MSRAQRLLDLIQALRGYRRPVSGATLAEALGISLRTLYRDIETLNAQGAHIDGEAGVGYVLRPGFMLPPLMFSEEEIEAIVLGSRWVANRADAELGAAARNALAKIAAVLPQDLKISLDTSSLLVGPGRRRVAGDPAGHPHRAQVAHLLCRWQRARFKTHHLAVRSGLFRPGAHGRGVVRDARGLSAFPDRPHQQGPIGRQALSPPPCGAAEGVAREQRHPGAIAAR
jgi:biotin operon repressor